MEQIFDLSLQYFLAIYQSSKRQIVIPFSERLVVLSTKQEATLQHFGFSQVEETKLIRSRQETHLR